MFAIYINLSGGNIYPLSIFESSFFVFDSLKRSIIAKIINANDINLQVPILPITKKEDFALWADVSEDVASGSGIQITAIEGDTSREPNVTEDVADASVVPETILCISDYTAKWMLDNADLLSIP